MNTKEFWEDYFDGDNSPPNRRKALIYAGEWGT